jgi:ADP-dependent NAD(P)H-hydrate dehydratase / NAD(P)H-hydrate epimerase
MKPILSREQIRELDRLAIEENKVPSLVLMENAGRGAAEVIEAELLSQTDRARSRDVVIVCGAGNNGGDGFVVARRLRNAGFSVLVFLAASALKLKGDARANHDAWVGLGGGVSELSGPTARIEFERALGSAGLLVDALFGTGLDREVKDEMRALIEMINAAPCPKVALDVPSGLDANTGAVLGACIRADLTVTFAHYKLGLLTTSGAEHAGRLRVADIGLPDEFHGKVGHSAELIEAVDVAATIARRPAAAHKASAGRVVIVAGSPGKTGAALLVARGSGFSVAGSPGKTGAALLVARGALRAGAGLVTIATSPEAADALDRRVLEEMTARLDLGRLEESLERALEGAGAVAVGPGIGLDADARRIVDQVVLGWEGTKIVDADALTHFAGRASDLKKARGRLLLTPHPGEMARLLATTASEVERDRFSAVRRAVDLTGATVLLKGPRTLIGAPEVVTRVNASGTPALATGGAGDVLSGICAALACSAPLFTAATNGAHLHGLAAERWAARTGADRGLLAHEIADELPGVFAGLKA